MAKIFGCDIGFGEESQITSSSKMEDMSNIFLGQDNIESVFNCDFISRAKLDLIKTGMSISTGILRLTLNENGDESVGIQSGEIGEWGVILHSTIDPVRLAKLLKTRLESQKISADVAYSYKTSKTVNGLIHHFTFEVADIVIDEENFEQDGY